MPVTLSTGETAQRVKPYVIDLSRLGLPSQGGASFLRFTRQPFSANGTMLNNKPIEPQRYYELKVNDMLKFGTWQSRSPFSTPPSPPPRLNERACVFSMSFGRKLTQSLLFAR